NLASGSNGDRSRLVGAMYAPQRLSCWPADTRRQRRKCSVWSDFHGTGDENGRLRRMTDGTASITLLAILRLLGRQPGVYTEERGNGGGGQHMSVTVEAVYEGGVLKVKQPLPFAEHETVQVTVQPTISWAQRTAGLIKWKGDPEDLRRIAEDDEFSILESP